MTLVVFPFACWTSTPQGTFDGPCRSSEDGRIIVIALSNGNLWICQSQGLDAAGQVKIEPLVLLLGHAAPVSVIALCRLEIQGPVSTETVAVTGAENGELIMWDLQDGRCLQTAFLDWMGAITGLQITTSGTYFICTGHSNYIAILDSSCLQVVKKINVMGDWISSLLIMPTENAVDKVYCTLLDGSIREGVFDEKNQTLIQIHSIGYAPNIFKSLSNAFDRRIMLLIQKESALVYFTDGSTTRLVVKIESPPNTFWQDAKFLSLRTLLLWTCNGQSNLYYLGPESDVCLGTRNSASDDVIVIASNGEDVAFVKDLKMGNLQSYRYATLVARFLSPDDTHAWTTCHIPLDSSLSRSAQHLIQFDARLNVSGMVAVRTFWAHLFGSQISPVHSLPPSVDFKLPIFFASPSHGNLYVWNVLNPQKN